MTRIIASCQALGADTYVYLKNTYNSNGPNKKSGYMRMNTTSGTAATDYAPGSTYEFQTAQPLPASTVQPVVGGVRKHFESYGTSSGLEHKLFDRTAVLTLDLRSSYAHTWYPAQVVVTDAGSERMNRPDPSGRNSSGRNANSSVAVQPSTASAIWSVAAIAASTREYPARR
jgi:hypothetical protein